jgi:hypothetical protein
LLKLRRDVKKGEEALYDYGKEYTILAKATYK